MRKYPPNESVCGAIYDSAPADNPFLAALPEMLPRDEFLAAIRSTPGLPHSLPQMSPEERRQSLPPAGLPIRTHGIYVRYLRSDLPGHPGNV